MTVYPVGRVPVGRGVTVRIERRYAIAAAMAVAAIVSLAALIGMQQRDTNEADVDHFLQRYWQHPLEAQGDPPVGFSPVEASLAPGDCGQCHADQYRDWSASLHHQTMGPGINWQFDLMAPAEANRCLRCHAPLAEQKALVARSRDWPNAPAAPPPQYVPTDLAQQGLVCAACHVRKHRRYGPPPSQAAGRSDELPHGGFESVTAFEDSRFCAVCHQFPEDGPRLNGKLHEDTYAQWRASSHAGEGRTCQSCHMPERRHLWKGIHDPDMVRQALDVGLEVNRDRSGIAKIRATLANSGAGHHFPTYMVPKVAAILYLVSEHTGERVELTRKIIGWQVDVQITQERFDTRIPAGETMIFEASARLRPEWTGWVELQLSVQPREHYARVFRYMLGQGDQVPAATRQTIRDALGEAQRTGFDLVMARTAVAAIAN